MTFIAYSALLLSVITVIVTVNGVVVIVDFSGVVAPLVVDGLLGIEVVVGAPLVPGVVSPLVVALTLVTSLSVRVVVVGLFESFVAVAAVAVIFAISVIFLMSVMLVINTVGGERFQVFLWCLPFLNVRIGFVLIVAASSYDGDKSSSESGSLKQDYFCLFYLISRI